MPEANDYIAFQIGPVQTFIESARSIRDLWTGSYLLSWLTVAALDKVKHPETEIISPHLDERKNPLWLAFKGMASGRDIEQKHLTPCLPNNFRAKVPKGRGTDFAAACKEACHDEWTKICKAVRDALAEKFAKETPHFKEIWKEQTESFFEIRTVVIPADANVSESLIAANVTVPEHGWDVGELLGVAMDLKKQIRHVPNYKPTCDEKGPVAVKCSLMGTYEQLGPPEFNKAKEFWEGIGKGSGIPGKHLRKSERFCALALVKRFAWPVYFADKRFRCSTSLLRFLDTATVSARYWLEADAAKGSEAIAPEDHARRGRWNGTWLSARTKDADPEDICPDDIWNRITRKRSRQGPPPIYYAILMMDGDALGKEFRGDGDAKWGKGMERSLELSRALANFAVGRVENLVEEYRGELIYSGGDDTLAVMPIIRAIRCAKNISDAYQKAIQPPEGGAITKTVSAGLAIVHYKEDLRYALEVARRAEKEAKGPKNSLSITVCRGSGGETNVTFPWSLCGPVDELTKEFVGGVSDRWTYALQQDAKVWEHLGKDAQIKEIKRQIGRSEFKTEDHKKVFLGLIERLWKGANFGKFSDFVALCQTASFLARGRDR